MAADLDCDAVIVGSGPGGSTVADVLTAAGWSVIVLEKGRNHLISLESPFEPAGDLSNDEIKFHRRHFLGPDPFLEPRTYRRGEGDGDRLFVGISDHFDQLRMQRRFPAEELEDIGGSFDEDVPVNHLRVVGKLDVLASGA